MSYSPLKTLLIVKDKEYPEFYNKVRKTLEELGITQDLLKSRRIITHYKLSSGNTNPPQETKHYYERMGSILRCLVENPRGIKYLQKKYQRFRSNWVRPPRSRNSGGSFLRRCTKLLKENKLLASNSKGYYTSKEGKDILIKCLKA